MGNQDYIYDGDTNGGCFSIAVVMVIVISMTFMVF